MTHTAATAPVEVLPEAPPGDSVGLTVKSISPRQMAVRRYLGHKPAVIATVVLLVMIIYVLLAPITGKLIADLVLGAPADEALVHFRANRF